MIPYIMAGYPAYVKKEDAKEILTKAHKILSLLCFAGTFTSLLYGLFLIPVLADSYYLEKPDFTKLPFLSYFFILYSLIGIGLGIYYLKTTPDYKLLDDKLRQYKPGEMILISKIRERKEMVAPLLYIILQLIPLFYGVFNSLSK